MRSRLERELHLPSPRLNNLLVLRRLAGSPQVTQAEIARSTRLSVAMVNGYLKQLCAAGLLEYRRKSTRTVSYHLTEAGERELARLSYELTAEMVRFFGDAKAALLEDIIERAHGLPREVAIVGCDDLAEVALHALEAAGARVIAVVDSDPRRVGQAWCGRPVLPPERLLDLAPDAVLVTVARPRRPEAVLGLLGCSTRVIDLDRAAVAAMPAEADHDLVPTGPAS